MNQNTIIPWAQPTIGKEEMDEVVDSFRMDWLTMGPKVQEFENKMAEFLDVPYAVAVSNGSVALDIALKMLGVGPGDEIIVPAMTYFATAAAVSYQHAVPVFVDVEPESYNMDPEMVLKALSPKTKGIIYIDYGGNPADYKGLKKVASSQGIFLLQDAAQSLGGIYNGQPVGAQTELSTMSFHMAKVMTTVEGGMIFTHNEKFAQEAKIRRNQGESGKYHHSHLGTNARMNDMAAGIGLAQYAKLQKMLIERNRVARRYDSKFLNCSGIEIMSCARENSKHAYFFYPVLVKDRDELSTFLKENGVDTRVAYPMPLYKQKLYNEGENLCRVTSCPVTENFTGRVINLPIFPELMDNQVDQIADLVIKFVKNR
jgi:dTDP-4-amino-4,6-dideoxygalactose transaminase